MATPLFPGFGKPSCKAAFAAWRKLLAYPLKGDVSNTVDNVFNLSLLLADFHKNKLYAEKSMGKFIFFNLILALFNSFSYLCKWITCFI